MESKPTENQMGSPGWWRANAAAKMAGLSADMLVQAAQSRQIPVRVEAFGQRKIWHVHVREFLAWLESNSTVAGK